MKWKWMVVVFTLTFLESNTATFYAKEINKYSDTTILKPILPQRPFLAVWNVETDHCITRYNVTMDLSSFDIVNNPTQERDGDHMVIFYSKQLGYYPNYDNTGKSVNGGIPQLGDIAKHYQKSVEDIENIIPDKDFSGLAVIDWEAWKPIWEYNGWGTGLLYQKASIDKVQQEHPTWSKSELQKQAKIDFESAAKDYMLGTLNLAKLLRPKASWGYYLYPDCYNYAKNGSDFTCHSNVIERNDRMQWLFDASTGLFPSTYVGLWFKNSQNTVKYAGYRILEALRLDYNRLNNEMAPIYGYNNLVYRKTSEFLTLKDVIHSSGIAAALGASGVVIWGDNMTSSLEKCQSLKHYIDTVLGKYLKRVSDGAAVCSIDLCHGHGRCIIKQMPFSPRNSPPSLFQWFIEVTIPDGSSNYTVSCQCYVGFRGDFCENYAV